MRTILLIVTLAALAAAAPAAAAPGALDPSFGSGGTLTTPLGPSFPGATFHAVVRQPDGRIVAGGEATKTDGTTLVVVARYLANGTLDQSFGVGHAGISMFQVSGSAATSEVDAVALQPDGKIVLAGSTDIGGKDRFLVVRLLTDGNPDPSFDGQPGDNGNGFVVTDFSTVHDFARSIVAGPGGTLTVAGQGSDGTGGGQFLLARYRQTDGSLDTSFGTGGKVLTDFFSSSLEGANAVAVTPDGGAVAGGFGFVGGTEQWALARYGHTGTLIDSFGTNGNGKQLTPFTETTQAAINALALLPDGRIVAAGEAGGLGRFALARYSAGGLLDHSFGAAGQVVSTELPGIQSIIEDVAVDPTGRILAAGFDNLGGGDTDFAVARYAPGGTLDRTYGTGGFTTTSLGQEDVGEGIALAPEGRAVVAGSSGASFTTRHLMVARYLGDPPVVPPPLRKLTPPPPDPRILSASLRHARFSVASGGTALSAKRTPRGSAFRVRLSEAAALTIRIAAIGSGRHKRRGGTLTRAVRSGTSSIAFSGRVGRRALKPGRYRATLVASTAGALHASAPRRLSFTIVALPGRRR